jgi:hypothetical protein
MDVTLRVPIGRGGGKSLHPWTTCRMSRLRNRSPFDFGLNAKIHALSPLRSIGAKIPRAVFAPRCSAPRFGSCDSN